ncbi:MAG TPA: M56 family metallopeptidase [Thermoanaerobaculia bacterium]|jgi:beta-lactamase regulating signal transducer with metallopeptidase domain/tetratricopeptide (TPR) repeat protein|nr:M56 family metallopeptidase [Thermoanaerobaculia bacterium]
MQSLIDTAFALQRSGAFELLLPLLLKATLIALVGRLVIAAVPRASAATRYLVALTTLAALLLLPVMTMALPSWRLAILPTEAKQTVGPALQPAPSSAPAAPSLAGPPSLANELSSDAPKVLRAAAVVADSGARVATFLGALRASWRGWFLIAVLAIAFAMLGRLAVGIGGIWWVTRRGTELEDEELLTELDRACDRLGIRQLVRVLTSEHVDVPLVWGVRKPVLLLPAQAMTWTRERLHVVFLHELAHLRRRDAVTLLITRGAAAIWWFHPVVWSLDRTARRDCEQACDDLVLGAGTRASDYADHLLSIARLLPHRDPFGAVTLAMSRRSQLEGRLLSILQPHVRRASTSRNAAIVAAALALLLVIPIASMQLTAAPSSGGDAKVVQRVSPSPAPSATVSVVADRHSHDEQDVNDTEDGKKLDDFHGFMSDLADHLHRGWYERGNRYLQQRQYERAIAAYEKAVETDDKPAKAAYNAACAYSLQNDRDHAFQWLDKAVELGYADADQYIEDSDLDPLRTDPRFQRLIDRMARSRRGDQRLQEAMMRDDRLRARGTATSQEWAATGADLLRLRELTRAVDALQHAVATEPGNTNAWHNLACAYALAGDQAHALDALEKSVTVGANSADQIKRDPDLASLRAERRYLALVDLARSLELNGGKDGKEWISGWLGGDDESNWREAAKYYEDVTRQHPDVGRAWFNLGFARLKTDNADGAAAAFQKALALGHRPATSSYNLGCSYAKAGNRDAAIQALQSALDRGMDISDYLDSDDDLDSLRNDARFAALQEKAQARHPKD